MPMPLASIIDLEYMPGWKAALIWAALSLPVVWLGMRSLAGLGPVRKWVAIAARLLVLLGLVLVVGGARWTRKHKTVDVMVLRDISESTQLLRQFPGRNYQESVYQYLRAASEEAKKPNRDDRIGLISFGDRPLVDSMPNTSLVLNAQGIREGGSSTDIASAIQLALATSPRDAMRRILLISDGLHTAAGDLEAALAAAVAQRVPIDVMPLRFNVTNEVLVERVVAPSWKRESDAFDVSVSLVSTNPVPVRGKLTLLEEGVPVEQRVIEIEGGTISDGRLEPRKHVEYIRVPALKARGVRRFTAVFEPEIVNVRSTGESTAAQAAAGAGDTLLQNNKASAFTFVQGQGKVLYVDNSLEAGGRRAGQTLADALKMEGLNVDRVDIDHVPEDLVALQAYDAVILNNVPRGRTLMGGDGLSEKHDAALAAYVHDFGGGLVMIGGRDSFGAGGWQASKIESVMPVNFDIPAQRQLPKGALVLIVHSCEMPDGNYWGEQCALKAVETLSSQDDVGVISYRWQAGQGWAGINNSTWDFPLGRKGDGQAVTAAIKKMTPMDMPSFDDTLQLALFGAGPANAPCLINSNAAQKHIIIISDGDPQRPSRKLIDVCKQHRITISTVSVYPHGPVSSTMRDMARETGGRSYGPIEANPSQLPQIFIKEASVVRRTLIQERLAPEPPFAVSVVPHASDIMKGIKDPPPIRGFVLSVKKKNDPSVEMPIVASVDGNKIDPLFAHWQAGLGKTAAFASDASTVWQEAWLAPAYAAQYGKFWSQVVRGVSRPPMSSDFAITTVRNGDRATINVEAIDRESGFTSFLNIRGVVVDPDGKQQEVRLVQTGPGAYTAEFPAGQAGNYVVALRYTGPENKAGWLVSGVAVNDSPEMRSLKSNETLLEEIARRTNGRVLPPFDPDAADLFSREGLVASSSPLPVWDILIPILLGLMLLDVAIRRIAWDWNSTKRLAAATADFVRSFTLARKVDTERTLHALKRVRGGVAEERFKQSESPLAAGAEATAPDRTRKFEGGKGVEGDIAQVVGGATAKPVPPPPSQARPKGPPPGPGDHTGSLLEAKRRAQQKIREKEQGQQ